MNHHREVPGFYMGPQIFATIKKIDFLHLVQSTYLKTYFERYYHSFFQKPLIRIHSTIKEESFHIFTLIAGKLGTSYIHGQRCGPHVPHGVQKPPREPGIEMRH